MDESSGHEEQSSSPGDRLRTSSSGSHRPTSGDSAHNSISNGVENSTPVVDSQLPNAESLPAEEEENAPSLNDLIIEVASLIKKRVSLSLLKPEMWTDDHFEVIQSFVADTTKRTMICYIDSIAGFTISLTCPVFQVEELQ